MMNFFFMKNMEYYTELFESFVSRITVVFFIICSCTEPPK